MIRFLGCPVAANVAAFSQIEEDWIKASPDWVQELEIMVDTKTKAEIQALSSLDVQYLTHEYLPLKLQEGGWI